MCGCNKTEVRTLRILAINVKLLNHLKFSGYNTDHPDSETLVAADKERLVDCKYNL
jgi:hypothetical protein